MSIVAHSILSPAVQWDNSVTQVNEKHHVIKGEMITVQKVYSDLDYFELESKYRIDLANVIKEELLDILVDELMKHNCVSFTMQQDHTTLERCFRARIFATPDDLTRVVKELLDK